MRKRHLEGGEEGGEGGGQQAERWQISRSLSGNTREQAFGVLGVTMGHMQGKCVPVLSEAGRCTLCATEEQAAVAPCCQSTKSPLSLGQAHSTAQEL